MLKLYVRKKVLPFRYANLPFTGEWEENTILHVTDELGRSFQVQKVGDFIITYGYSVKIVKEDFDKLTKNPNSNISDLLKAGQNVWIISASYKEAEICSKENNIPWASISDSCGNKLFFVVSPISDGETDDLNYMLKNA